MVLVTGATGLVGGNLLWYLLQSNERVAATRRMTSNLNPLRVIFSFYTKNPDDYLARIDWKIADVMEIDSLQNAMVEVTELYHCAAVVSLGNNTDKLLDTNIIGTRNIVDVALKSGVRKLCFVSSIAACGREFEGKEISESSTWKENAHRSAYSRSKYLSEQELWKGIEKGLNVVIVNPGVVLGVSGSNGGSARLFDEVRKGLKFYTKGGSGYVDVQDVVKVMIRLTNSDISGKRFILVSENCSNKDVLSWIADGFKLRRPFIGIGKHTLYIIGFLVEKISKVFHFEPFIDRSTARSATNREYYSNKRIENTIHFKFKPIRESIAEICDFLNKN